MTPAEAAKAVRDGLDQYAQVDVNGQPVTDTYGGKKKLNTNMSATLAVALDPANDGVAIYGSDDGGATKRIIKTDAGGAIQVDLEVATVAINRLTPGTTNTVAIISGQDGIAGGTGVDGATVPRMSLATNVPLPSGTNSIGKLGTNSGVTIGAVELVAAQTLGTVTTVGTITTITNPVGVKGADGVAIASNANPVPISDAGGSLTIDYATTGSGTSTGALRVELPTNGTGVVGLNAGTQIVGKFGVDQTSPGVTNFVQNKVMPDATATFASSNDVSGALEASSISKASAGVFYGLSGYNTGPTQWVMVVNSATVPANGAVTPIVVIRATTGQNFSFDSGKFPQFCSAGISWYNSIDATIFNKTLGATDCFVNLSYA